MHPAEPQPAISRVLDAPRALVFRAFTDPDHLRVEFQAEPDGRTPLEIRQWLPAYLAGPGSQGWLEALEKLDTTLLDVQAAATDVEV